MQPIALCNVLVKTITKVVAKRLKTLMPKLVRPNQCSFITGRHASDNVIIAQEVLHTMRRKKRKGGCLVVQIDFKKAYHRMNWNFLKSVLISVGLEPQLEKLIMVFVESTSMSILWNGEVLDAFKPSWGLRQGDLLSPYLFLLCMEVLNQKIQVAIDGGK